jgi:hypothetical protein
MSKFLTFILGAFLGFIFGGVLIFYFFSGAPRAVELPGQPIQSPDPNGLPTGTATVVLNQQFFDTVLETIFSQMNAPAFPLNLTGQNNYESKIKPEKIAFFQENTCDGKITLLPEGSGVKTSVRLENGKINAPLAFKGTYSVLGQCLEFAGWAQANLQLRYDQTQQDVYGQIQVETVNLDGVSPIASGLVTPLVQTTLNNRVNPITILKGKQIALSLPISATDGILNAQVKDVRAEVKENALSLFISYDFTGTKAN